MRKVLLLVFLVIGSLWTLVPAIACLMPFSLIPFVFNLIGFAIVLGIYLYFSKREKSYKQKHNIPSRRAVEEEEPVIQEKVVPEESSSKIDPSRGLF